MRIALIGARGFVGTALSEAFKEAGGHDVVPVGRETYAQAREAGPYDIVVNAAMPSKRFAAAKEPLWDFSETVTKTADLIAAWKWTKFVQISSISARSQPETYYGRHKAAAEALCRFGDNLIIRLGPMYGPTLTKGVLVDMLHDRTVFVASDSVYGFAPLDWVARTIAANVGRSGIVEVGARDGVPLYAVAEAIGARSSFEGVRDDQVAFDPPGDAPPAADVISFLEERRSALFA